MFLGYVSTAVIVPREEEGGVTENSRRLALTRSLLTCAHGTPEEDRSYILGAENRDGEVARKAGGGRARPTAQAKRRLPQGLAIGDGGERIAYPSSSPRATVC